MPFKVETTTTVKWESADGQTDDSRFMIFRENGNMMPLIGAADWTDAYPAHRLCLVQECWPESVKTGALNLIRVRGTRDVSLQDVRALILSELKVGAPSIRIGLTTSHYYHDIIDDHQTVLEGRVTGLAVID